MKGKSPMLKAYGITEEEAREVEEVTQEIILKFKTRDRIIKELKKRFKGNKLLYAVGFVEYHAGYGHAIQKINTRVMNNGEA